MCILSRQEQLKPVTAEDAWTGSHLQQLAVMSGVAADGVVPVATADDGGCTWQHSKAVPAFQVCRKRSAQHPAETGMSDTHAGMFTTMFNYQRCPVAVAINHRLHQVTSPAT